MNPIKLIVHPGIGDLSWLFSKLSTTGRKFDLVIAEDTKTRRSMPLVDMVECVNSAKYGGRELYSILYAAKNSTFKEYLDAHESGKDLVMTANWWLDAGNRLEGFLPDVNTDFHYDIHGNQSEIEWAEHIVEKDQKDGPVMAIYTSSGVGIENWRAWSAVEWIDFMYLVKNEFPDVKFYLMGAKWDQDICKDLLRLLDHLYIDYRNFIGKTSLGKALELLRRVDYFVGFASGLTILANVIETPVTMMYPMCLKSLTYSWPCPISMANGSYKGLVWERTSDIFNKIKPQLNKWLIK